MQKKSKRFVYYPLVFLALALSGWLSFLYISTNDIAVLNPKGMIGLKERNVIAAAFSLMLIVVIPVFIMTLFFAWRYRKSNTKAAYRPNFDKNPFVEGLWWGIPLVIIVILAVIVWESSYALNPFKPIENGKKPLKIQVVALDWKWLFIYPEQEIASVNFVQFPKDTPLNFEITADAPMNSFWIPQLGGQIYAMPAMRSKLHLIANETGEFKGSSANISGKGFAGMTFIAKSSSVDDFNAWVSSVKSSGQTLDGKTYKKLAEPSEYNKAAYYKLAQRDLFEKIVGNRDTR